ncbi:MAG: hypothetical protein AAGF11_16220 [Myxococcota bacterium]
MKRAGFGRLVGATLAIALAWPANVHAEPKDPKARQHIKQGQAALARDDYDTAIDWYEKALAIEREPKVLYLLGQAEFLRGRCRASVRYFSQVKEFDVGATVADAMRPYLAECAEQLADEPTPAPISSTESDPPSDEDDAIDPLSSSDAQPAPTDERGPKSRRWYQDPAGDVLVAVGVAGAVAGGSMMLVARGQRTGATTYGDLEEAAGGIRSLQIAGAATLGIGAALMIGGFIRWGLIARKGRGPGATARTDVRTNVRMDVTYDGSVAGLSVAGRF